MLCITTVSYTHLDVYKRQVLTPIYSKCEYIEPLASYTEGIEAGEDTSSVDALLIKEENTPKAAASFLPLLLPAVMSTYPQITVFTFIQGRNNIISYTPGVTKLPPEYF